MMYKVKSYKSWQRNTLKHTEGGPRNNICPQTHAWVTDVPLHRNTTEAELFRGANSQTGPAASLRVMMPTGTPGRA